MAAFLTAISLIGMSAPAQAADSGSLTWGFKSSWRTYVTTIAAGTITTSGGATASSGEYVFPQDSTTQTSPTGTGITKYAGSVNWKSTAHGFNITMTDPWLEVTSSTEATLTADLTDNAGNSRGRVDVATVTLNDPAVESDSLTWTDRPTVITEDAAETFTNYANAAGDPLDAVVYKDGIGNEPAPLCDGKPATVQLALDQVPTSGDDVIVGTEAGESINGGEGNDTICALGGNDFLYGGAGNDKLLGGDGDDGISGGLGGDTAFGGAGADLVSYASATAGVRVTIDNVANDGNATDARADNVLNDVERINGSSFADTLLVSSGVNNFYGFGGADLLNGYAGNDYLNGGAHADSLYGGVGNDGLYAKEGYRDTVIDAGAGTDWAARDAGDPVARNVP
jgi:Ca2+-binding RTX toxin-like protein